MSLSLSNEVDVLSAQLEAPTVYTRIALPLYAYSKYSMAEVRKKSGIPTQLQLANTPRVDDLMTKLQTTARQTVGTSASCHLSPARARRTRGPLDISPRGGIVRPQVVVPPVPS